MHVVFYPDRRLMVQCYKKIISGPPADGSQRVKYNRARYGARMKTKHLFSFWPHVWPMVKLPDVLKAPDDRPINCFAHYQWTVSIVFICYEWTKNKLDV